MAQNNLSGVGPRGPRGEAGGQGQPGFGVLGFDGEEGPEGPQGPVGPQGTTGATGATGAQGVQGSQGPPGDPGEQGEQGDPGPPGPAGPAGAAGTVSDWTAIPQRRLGVLQAGSITAPTGGTGFVTFGTPPVSTDGTVGAVQATSTGGGFDGGIRASVGHTTGTGTNALSGHRSTVEWTDYQHEPIVKILWATGADVTNLRIWIGLFSTLPVSTDDPTGHVAGFRLSNASGGAGDTTFRVLTKDGTTLNNQDSTIAPVASTAYLFEIDMINASQIVFRLRDGTSDVTVTSVANLPTSTTALFWVFRCANGNSGAARTIRTHNILLSTN